MLARAFLPSALGEVFVLQACSAEAGVTIMSKMVSFFELIVYLLAFLDGIGNDQASAFCGSAAPLLYVLYFQSLIISKRERVAPKVGNCWHEAITYNPQCTLHSSVTHACTENARQQMPIP